MSHRPTLALAAAALVALPASVASADNLVTDASIRVDDEAFEIRLEAREALGEPRVRTSPGFVRVWFPEMAGTSIDRDGDGEAVRFVRVRPGYDDTAVTLVRLGDMRRLDADDVRVSRDGSVARIRLARAALPTIAGAAPPAERAAAEAPAEAPEVEAETEAAAEAEAATETDATTEAETGEEPSLMLARRSEAAPLPASSGPSTAVILAVLTLLLGGGYLALRFFGGRLGRRAARPDIEVVAQKRIGGRHQLLVVRALGEDHLLAVHAGRTEKLASMPAREGEADASGDGGERDLLPFLRLGQDSGEAADEARPQTLHRQPRPGKVDTRPRFGAELMKLVGERSRADAVSLGAQPAPSEAVAGLLRLREKLGR